MKNYLYTTGIWYTEFDSKNFLNIVYKIRDTYLRQIENYSLSEKKIICSQVLFIMSWIETENLQKTNKIQNSITEVNYNNFYYSDNLQAKQYIFCIFTLKGT